MDYHLLEQDLFVGKLIKLNYLKKEMSPFFFLFRSSLRALSDLPKLINNKKVTISFLYQLSEG